MRRAHDKKTSTRYKKVKEEGMRREQRKRERRKKYRREARYYKAFEGARDMIDRPERTRWIERRTNRKRRKDTID